MSASPLSAEINELVVKIEDLKKQLADMRRAEPPLVVDNYEFQTSTGPVTLSSLFGDKNDLLVIHNMGIVCSYCTLWADGFNGVVPEMSSRCGYVLVTPDPLDVAIDFTTKRGWRFPIVVDESKKFSTAVGRWKDGGIYPGVSGFRKDPDGAITRIATADLGPGDDFCPTWHLLELLKDGANGWEPDYRL